jgi:hypothetical protein
MKKNFVIRGLKTKRRKFKMEGLKSFVEALPEVGDVIHLLAPNWEPIGCGFKNNFMIICGIVDTKERVCESKKWQYQGKKKRKYQFVCQKCQMTLSLTGNQIKFYCWKLAE